MKITVVALLLSSPLFPDLLFPHCRFHREKNKSLEKLKLLVKAIEEKQLWKDQALLSAVDQLVRFKSLLFTSFSDYLTPLQIQEAIVNFQDVVDETELIAIIEEILTHFPATDSYYPSPPLVDDYSIVNVTRKPQSEPQEETIPNPYPIENQEIGLQTSLSSLDEEKEEISPPSPKTPTIPTTPQIIIQQTNPPPTITVLPAEPRPTVEKELIELLNTIITTQQQSMQGQQALLLSLIQQKPEYTDEERTEGEKSLEMFLPEPEPTPKSPFPIPVEPIPETSISAKESSIDVPSEPHVELKTEEFPPTNSKKVNYNTCFGEFLLSGKLLHGKYCVPEKLPFTEYEELFLTHEGDEPRLRRRANPLTLKLLNQPDSKSLTHPPKKEEEINGLGQQQFLEFANKLLETVSPRKHEESLQMKDIQKAVHDGIALGVKQVLGYFPTQNEIENPEKYMKGKAYVANNLGKSSYEIAFESRTQRKLQDRNLKYLEEVWDRNPTKKKEISDSTRKGLTANEIRSDIQDSQRNYRVLKDERKERLLDDDVEEVSSYNDSISLSEEYFAFYGDEKHRKQNKIDISRYEQFDISDFDEEESLEKMDEPSEAQLYSAKNIVYEPEEDKEEHEFTLTSANNNQLSNPQTVKKNETVDQYRSLEVLLDEDLPPLISSVLVQPETQRNLSEKENRAARFSSPHRTYQTDLFQRPQKERFISDASDNDVSEEEARDDASSSSSPSSAHLHRDHRTWKQKEDRNLPLTLSDDSPLSNSISESNLSIDTASTTSVMETVKKHQKYRSSQHSTRYSLSEDRLKRKSILSSVNSKKREEDKPSEMKFQEGGFGKLDDPPSPDVGSEHYRGPTELEISLSAQQSPSRSYNSLLSSEESSLLSADTTENDRELAKDSSPESSFWKGMFSVSARCPNNELDFI